MQYEDLTTSNTLILSYVVGFYYTAFGVQLHESNQLRDLSSDLLVHQYLLYSLVMQPTGTIHHMVIHRISIISGTKTRIAVHSSMTFDCAIVTKRGSTAEAQPHQ